MRNLKTCLKLKRRACSMRVTRENFKCVLSTCRLQGWLCDHSQRSGLLRTSKVLEKAADGNVPHVRWLQCFQNRCDDDIVNIVRKFGVMIEHQDRLFVLGNPRLQWSFGLAIVYKIALTAIDSVNYSRWWTVSFILLFRSRENTVDGSLWLLWNL